MFAAWSRLCLDTAMLAFESQAVIGLRLAKLADGGTAAQAEMQRMVSEKLHAAGEAAILMARGGSGVVIVARYRRKVRQNWRRLRQADARG